MSLIHPNPDQIALRTLLARHSFRERREHQRRSFSVCAVVIPLNGKKEIDGPIMVGHGIDISNGGMKLWLLEEVEAPFLYIQPHLENSKLGFTSATLEILRREDDMGTWTYAGRFVESSPRTNRFTH
ncbi:MAG: PilZ domain-containing protein [Planctomycetaceae bacterium]